MDIAFSAADVQAWADFSGDHNPIHFDRAAARLAGLDDLVVHGMLVLVPVKQFLSDNHQRLNGEGRSARFKAFFRSPVLYDQSQSVTLRTRSPGRTEFSVRSAETQAESLRGFLTHAAAPDAEPAPDAARRRLDDSGSRLASFAARLPAIDSLWIWLDALAFSEFVRRDMHGVASRALGQWVPDRPANGIPGVSIMQTSQDVFISEEVADARLSRMVTARPEILSYSIETSLVVASLAEVSGTVRTAVWIDGMLAIQAEYGLLVRSHSLSNQLAMEGADHVGR
jgi:hypothetical protein